MKQIFSILILYSLIYASLSFANGIAENDKAIFILHSYSQEYAWTRNEHLGFVKTLTNNKWTGGINFAVEYLDTKRIPFDLNYRLFFYNYLQKKYENFSPDLIFCTDDNALDFLVQFKNKLFGRTPVVFCGINDFNALQKLNRQEYTGVFEKKEFLPNLELINKLFPHPDQIRIVGDDSNTCRAIVKKIKNDLKSKMPKQAFDFLITNSFETMLSELKSMKKGIIFLTTLGGLKDKNGNVIPLKKAIGSIVTSGHFTIISMEDVYLHEGVLGGYVTSGISQGKKAAELAIKILMGKSAISLPVMDKSPNQYMFNYPELVRMNFPLSMLPEQSIVHNKPVSFYEQNKLIIWGFIIAFILLAIAFIGVSFGLINSRKAKKAVMKSEKKYRNLFESSLDAIVLFNPSKGFIDCNPITLKLFGLESKKQFLNLDTQGLSPLYQPDGKKSSAKFAEMVNKVSIEGSQLFEWKYKKSNGSLFDASVSLTHTDTGIQSLFQATIRDVSTMKHAQEMMIQTEKMMSIGGLAAGMAHEINNPLAGMMQNADLMNKRLTDTQLPKNIETAEEVGLSMESIKQYMEKRGILKMVEAVKGSGTRMARIVENMLSFARKEDTAFSSHSMTELLDKTLDLASTDFNLKKRYDFKSLMIKKEYQTAPLVPCQASKIQQVFLNILKNGSQAMQEAGTEKPCFLLKIWFDDKSKTVCTEINDNGPGLDRETRERIFEPFFTTKPIGSGTGLGLSVSYFIITEIHKGKIKVVSKRGEGCNFIIRLPVDIRS